MNQAITIRRVRTVTHSYVTDTIELDPNEFSLMGAPQAEAAFADWIEDKADTLLDEPALSEITRLKLSKLNYYNEDRDQRVDIVKIEIN